MVKYDVRNYTSTININIQSDFRAQPLNENKTVSQETLHFQPLLHHFQLFTDIQDCTTELKCLGECRKQRRSNLATPLNPIPLQYRQENTVLAIQTFQCLNLLNLYINNIFYIFVKYLFELEKLLAINHVKPRITLKSVVIIKDVCKSISKRSVTIFKEN